MLEPDGQIILIGTRYDFNDLYSTILNELQDEYDVMVKPAIENGKLFFPTRLTAEFLEEQRKEQGEYLFSCQYLLNPIPTSLQVFKESDIKFYEDVPDNLTVFMACDPSLTEDEKAKGDYTAIVVVGIDKNNNWYILDAVNEHLSPDQINQKLFELYRYWGTIKIGIESVAFSKLLKPAFEKYVWEKGFNPYVEELKSGGTSKELRIKSLQPLYEQHKIYMPKPDFINNDVWAVLYSQLLHFPKSKFDDLCLVGETLVVTSRGNIPIKEIMIGDKVMTRKGWRNVISCGQTGIKKVISRFGITGTPNHPIITKTSIKPLEYISESDILYTWNEKQLCIKEKNITDILIRKEHNTENITGRISLMDRQFRFIARYGEILMGKFQKDLMYIIKTIIHLIIPSRTWSLSPTLTMQNIILDCPKEKQQCGETLLKTLHHFRRKQRLGGKHRKGKSGTGNMQEGLYSEKREKKFVLNVKKNMKLIARYILNFVRGVAAHVITHASFAERTPTIIKNFSEERKVYNLQVEGAHEFFANGILVHNCDSLAYINNLCHYRIAEPQYTDIQKRLLAKKKQLNQARFSDAYILK